MNITYNLDLICPGLLLRSRVVENGIDLEAADHFNSFRKKSLGKILFFYQCFNKSDSTLEEH